VNRKEGEGKSDLLLKGLSQGTCGDGAIGGEDRFIVCGKKKWNAIPYLKKASAFPSERRGGTPTEKIKGSKE